MGRWTFSVWNPTEGDAEKRSAFWLGMCNANNMKPFPSDDGKSPTRKWRQLTRFWCNQGRPGVLLLVLMGTQFFYVEVLGMDGGFSDNYQNCMDKSGGVTVEVHHCISSEMMIQDSMLNDTYKELLQKLPIERKNELVKSERVWLDFRDKTCALYNPPSSGTLERIIEYQCRLEKTSDRVRDLKLLLKQ